MSGKVDRMPPHNLEVEAALLGSLMMDPDLMYEVAAIVSADDFFRESHRRVYEIILDLYHSGQPFDGIMVDDEIRRRELRSSTGEDIVADLLRAVDSTANAVFRAGVVREHSRVRSLIHASVEIGESCYRRESPSDELLAEAEARIMEISGADRGGSLNPVMPANHWAAEALDNIRRRVEGGTIGIGTGFPAVDSMLGGLQSGRLYILAARPSIGKTSLALGMAFAAARAEARTLAFSLEMDAPDLHEKILAAVAGVDSHRVRTNPQAADLNACAMAYNSVSHIPLHTDRRAELRLSQIAAECRRMKARSGLGLVVIDYLQLISPPKGSKGDGRQNQVAEMSRGLKILARDLGVAVLVLSQLNRESEKRADKKPQMADLRESGAIEQDADVVMLLHRPSQYDPNDRPREADLIVAKNRSGPIGTIKLGWRPEQAWFVPWVPEPTYDGGGIEDF